ncbi:TPA: DUF2508 family protein [Streptococcus agalactiae]
MDHYDVVPDLITVSKSLGAEAKYFFLLKEAKRRPVKMEQW